MLIAHIFVTLKPSLFDAEGATIRRALHQLNHTAVHDVRIGKIITLTLDDSLPEAEMQLRLDQMCQQLLVNPVIEDYEISFSEQLAGDQPAGEPPSSAPATEAAAATASASPAPATSRKQRPEPRTSTGVAVKEPFALDFEGYNALRTEEKLSLRSMAWQKHGTWIMNQLNEHQADWILCIGGEVVEKGESLESYPSDEHLDELGRASNLAPWVFTRPSA